MRFPNPLGIGTRPRKGGGRVRDRRAEKDEGRGQRGDHQEPGQPKPALKVRRIGPDAIPMSELTHTTGMICSRTPLALDAENLDKRGKETLPHSQMVYFLL
jgi:hypothetical protein